MGFLSYLNPFRPITKTYASVRDSSSRVAQAFAEAKLSLERRKKLDAITGVQTASELFALKLEEVDEAGHLVWTPAALVSQRMALRRARRTFVFSAYVLTPLFSAVALFMPWWVAIFLLPCSLIFFVALIAKAAKHAWWEWQVETSQLESFTVFGGRRDFFKRVLWW